jgi:hypothetical protein
MVPCILRVRTLFSVNNISEIAAVCSPVHIRRLRLGTVTIQQTTCKFLGHTNTGQLNTDDMEPLTIMLIIQLPDMVPIY